MQQFSCALAGAALSVALLAGSGPAAATSLHPTPAVMNGDGPQANVQPVHDRRGYRSPRPYFRFGFGDTYPRRHYYRTYRCRDGYHYRHPYGCVAYRHYDSHRYYRPRPGVSLHFGF